MPDVYVYARDRFITSSVLCVYTDIPFVFEHRTYNSYVFGIGFIPRTTSTVAAIGSCESAHVKSWPFGKEKKRTRFIHIEYVSLGVLFIYFYSDVLLTSGESRPRSSGTKRWTIQRQRRNVNKQKNRPGISSRNKSYVRTSVSNVWITAFLYFSPRPQSKGRESLMAFSMANYRACKNVWKACVEHHTFFRLERPLPPQKNFFTHYFTLGSKFRYWWDTEPFFLFSNSVRLTNARRQNESLL